jgi:hypothetical protein
LITCSTSITFQLVKARPQRDGALRAVCWTSASLGAALALACSSAGVADFDPSNPARGPGTLVGNGAPVSVGEFGHATSVDPAPEAGGRAVCDAACEQYCGALAPSLVNPVDRGLCRSLWGVGFDTQPVVRSEACRRLFVDMLGRFPTRAEVDQVCAPGRPWEEVAGELLGRDEFSLVNQRMWADLLLYNNEAVSVERIFDMDALVGKVYRGLVSYDEFAAVVSAHPVLTRRYENAADRASALFELFLRRPPFENEQADMARLYRLWDNGYYDHPSLNLRLPDSTIRYRCVTQEGTVNEVTKGECTSVLWGHREVILLPDVRASEGTMWSGLLRPAEWQVLQEPGRVISQRVGFWEAAVDRVVEAYLGYDLAEQVPEVRQALVFHLLANNGDIRATHHAVVTSLAYLQSSALASSPEEVVAAARWTYGPLKQVQVEPWLDSIKQMTGYSLASCDHRIPQPDLLLEAPVSVASVSLVRNSRWELSEDGVRRNYQRLAQTLGGCPDNQAGGRFTAVGILSTAVQENLVFRVCNPRQDPEVGGVEIERLLPFGTEPSQSLGPEVAAGIAEHQIGLFFGRPTSPSELDEARQAASECAPSPCRVEDLARPLCYALLSSSEQLFY